MATITPIISRLDFVPYVDVASNLQDVKLNPRILEAQTFDLRPLMGNLYSYMVNNLAEPEIVKLIDGDTYTIDGIVNTFIGLKPVLVYFSAARLIKSLDLHITPNGMMTKRNEYSDHADLKAIAYKATEYQNLAIAYWNEVDTYINEQGVLVYPLYPSFRRCAEARSDVRSKIFGIGGRDTNGR